MVQKSKENTPRQSFFQSEDPIIEIRSTAKFVEHDIALMMHHRQVYKDFRKVFSHTDAEALRFGHFFFNAVWSWYTNSMLIAVRASIETSGRSKKARSLIGLLHRIENAPIGSFTDDERSLSKTNRVRLKEEAKNLYEHVSKLVAHREFSWDTPSIDEHETYRVLDLIDAILEQTLDIIFGADRQRLIVDADPYWTQHLFSFAWGLPSPFIERLAGSREARLVRKGQERDFTPRWVYSYRPTDAELAEYKISRAEFEQQRDDSYKDKS